MASDKDSNRGDGTVVTNRRARRDYSIEDIWECGVMLEGAEVKSLRDRRANLQDAFARVEDGEVWLYGMHVSPYQFASTELDPTRRRKLLLHRREIDRIAKATFVQGTTLIPLKVYFKDGRAKVELALARGKREIDKRQTIMKRQADREAERTLKERNR